MHLPASQAGTQAGESRRQRAAQQNSSEQAAQQQYSGSTAAVQRSAPVMILRMTKPCPDSKLMPAPTLRTNVKARPLQKWSSLQKRAGADNGIQRKLHVWGADAGIASHCSPRQCLPASPLPLPVPPTPCQHTCGAWALCRGAGCP